MDLTNEQWKRLRNLIPSPKNRDVGRGRPRREPREVLNGILWILRTGAPWKDLLPRYPPQYMAPSHKLRQKTTFQTHLILA